MSKHRQHEKISKNVLHHALHSKNIQRTTAKDNNNMSLTNPHSPKIKILLEIQEALLSILYPVRRITPTTQTVRPYVDQGPCCNCRRKDGHFSKTVFWIEDNCFNWDPLSEWYPAWVWLCYYYGSVNESYHYFSNPLCLDCALTIKQFIRENIIASFNVTVKQFDSICTFFPHELNRIVLQYTNPLLR